ncbi:MAG: hypothetical protein BJ554DRAFT_6048 [Olpidium bornovanus]|uniref:Uncharacterized protein n=1 Tax=Olpidium bornovanus TaxID=278681 RepID=A0A8H8DKB4_9FUNG|nr:MAG: hypothetical protein BJ554DRAFT_6048 [Olpidium bornovanus]
MLPTTRVLAPFMASAIAFSLFAAFHVADARKFVLIRHAEKPVVGNDLSEIGRARAECLKEYFANGPLRPSYIFAQEPDPKADGYHEIRSLQMPTTGGSPWASRGRHERRRALDAKQERRHLDRPRPRVETGGGRPEGQPAGQHRPHLLGARHPAAYRAEPRRRHPAALEFPGPRQRVDHRFGGKYHDRAVAGLRGGVVRERPEVPRAARRRRRQPFRQRFFGARVAMTRDQFLFPAPTPPTPPIFFSFFLFLFVFGT